LQAVNKKSYNPVNQIYQIMRKTIFLLAIISFFCTLTASAGKPTDGYILYTNDKIPSDWLYKSMP